MIESIVVHPGSIEVSSRDRVKTDKRDALKIAIQLAAGRLKGIYVPCEEQESRRCVSRLRHNIIKLRTQVGNQVKSLLFTQNLIDGKDDTRVTSKWLFQKQLEMKELNYPEEFMYTVDQYIFQWEELTRHLKKIQEKLKVQALYDIKIQRIYESVPGIGLIHGRELANELGDMKQFHNEKQLYNFTGLTPSEHSSGEHVRQGKISRQGRSILRKILIEAAWITITKDAHLQEIYERISRTRGKKRAIVGVARRLVGRIRACLSSDTLYKIKPFPHENIPKVAIGATS